MLKVLVNMVKLMVKQEWDLRSKDRGALGQVSLLICEKVFLAGYTFQLIVGLPRLSGTPKSSSRNSMALLHRLSLRSRSSNPFKAPF
jgi:hypothetical protein